MGGTAHCATEGGEMRRKNIVLIDELVEREYARKLRENGFHPYKDNTEWVRLVNGEIVQIVLFFEYHYWLEVFFYSELLSEFLWIDYRAHKHMDNVIATSYCNVRKCYGMDVYTMNNVFSSGADKLDAKVRELHRHLDCAIAALDEVKDAEGILALDLNEQQNPERVCLHYRTGNGELLEKALINAAELDPRVYPYDEPPEKPGRDYWQVWRVKRAFVCRRILQNGNLNILKIYADECKRYNERFLRKRVPQLFDD